MRPANPLRAAPGGPLWRCKTRGHRFAVMTRLSTPASHSQRWFTVHVLSHDPVLRAWLASRFPDLSDIEDIVQESYRRVWLAAEKNEIAEPRAFLFTTARHVAIDRLRRVRSAPFAPMAEDVASFVLDDEPDAAERTARNQELELLTEALQSLPARCRRVLTLRKIYGLSQKQISAELGISENTVESHLSSGMARLAAFFARIGLL